MATELPGYRRILVPLVDDRQSELALDIACSLASERRASLLALTVIEVPHTLPLDAHMLDEEEQAARLLERATAICDSYGVQMKPTRVRSRDVATAILQAATTNGTQLLVLAAPHRQHVDRHERTIGATVEAVLRGSRCRVMLLTDAAEARGDPGRLAGIRQRSA